MYDLEPGEAEEQVEEDTGKKKRHRRTKEELLKDPEYCKKHGLPLPDGYTEEEPDEDLDEGKQAPRKRSARRRKEELDEDSILSDAEVEGMIEENDGSDVVTSETPISIKPPPKSSFKRMFKTRWAFDVWDASQNTCVASHQLPDWVETEEEAFEEVKNRCNQNLREYNGCNIVIYEIHKEFRLAITQVTMQQ